MIKRIFMLCAFTFFSQIYIHADWLNNLAKNFGAKTSIDFDLAQSILQNYINRDEKNINRMNEKIHKLDNSVSSKVYNGIYVVELKALNAQKQYHEKVKIFLKELPENKTNRLKFHNNLIALNQKLEELKKLKYDYKKAAGVSESIKITSLLAAKKAEIMAYKTFIKGSFLFF